ncbi:cell elongation-specific peptidoglycan D,D-transpeptidase [Virgibacillus subterraneus]|uniref:serine-type D-Ala-D-Ala carboxypeptidase n=1 Tax=Virgibacillus subterraneus TaxID=621109 RepID=A0A1H9DZE5_9BACI|nr:penicillin-binding protein 2 [Virgibacillus subterraneus]SEQ18692.1 cell elongation-specific peptidoglycan D,D-transpeptidase [Virgibacillus subterraneus]
MVQKKKKKKSQLPFRLNILFFIVFLLFSVLILQLGVVQILNGEEFQAEIDKTENDYTEIPVPRGKMYDRNHNLIVDNNPLYSITYTPAKGIQAKDRLDVAEKLATYISMDPHEDKDGNRDYGVSTRNKKEYWYLNNTEEARSRLTDKEIEEMDNAEEYNTMLDRIKEEEIKGYSEKQLEIMAIKKEMDKAMTLTPQVIKNENVTPKEFARVAEHLDVLPGVNATTDWDREKPYGKTFSNFIGTITSQSQGILAEKEEYYLTRGYSRNDRVGRSGLEEQYENILRGRKEKIQYTTNKSGKVVESEVVVEGQRGKDLILTIDMELQEEINKILRKELKTAIQKAPAKNKYLEDALAVVMNPQTGELLAVAGQHYNRDDNEFENAGLKSLYAGHPPGSAVKGATVLSGYESGVIEPGQRFYDAPIKIAGTPEKSSYSNLQWVNDLDALRRSSNVYMFYIAMRMGGDFNYQRNDKLKFDPAAFQEMRNYFSQFGLGVKTGVDFPYESTGYKGPNPQAGNLLDFAIGQYDTYTTLQLAQYVSTIANDGYRVQPHFMKEIRMPVPHEDELGSVYQSKNTNFLNKIVMDDNYIERVQEGFRQVYQEPGGTATGNFADKEYRAAGKTGTAEYTIFHENGSSTDTENHSLVGYAPYDNPEVAFAVVVPHAGIPNAHPTSKLIGEQILDTYFDLQEEETEEE